MVSVAGVGDSAGLVIVHSHGHVRGGKAWN